MLVGGRYTVTAASAPITTTRYPCRVLTIRLGTGSGTLTFGNSKGEEFGYLLADESWTWGPNAGTVDPADIYVKGTAGNLLHWVGISVN